MLEVALHAFQSLTALEFVIKVLHCNSEIIESETLMTFLADDKVSENEQIKIALTPYRTDWSNKSKDGALRKVEKDPDELSKNDRIYLELFFNLDYYWKARMRGLELRRNFHGMYDDFRKNLGVVQEASQGLRNSSSFRELLDVFSIWIMADGRLF